MEKRILPIVILTFVIEVCFFLYDLGLLPFVPGQENPTVANRFEIGQVAWTKENVQRRHQDSIVWDESKSSQKLYSFDSVLTLKNSSAKLNLHGNIQLDLSENTLVVLEPPRSLDTSQFRIRFQKGNLRSQTQSENMAVDAGEWTVEANKNSDLSFQALPSGNLAVEIKQGSASLQSQSGAQTQVLSEGSILEINQSEIVSSKQISKTLTWETETLVQNQYSFEFPVSIKLEWKGPAKRLIAHNTRGDTLSVPLLESQKTKQMNLDPGAWVFRLENGGLSSQSLNLNLYPASRVSHLYPLPRSRLDRNLPARFSWISIPEADSYKITFRRDDDTEPITHLTKLPQWTQSFDNPGSYTWSVKALDESGFEIPNYYNYPIDVVNDPLAPPALKTPGTRTPGIRAPAKEKAKDGAWLDGIYHLLIPNVYAEEKNQELKRSLIFSWYPVPGADHYVVEISEEPDFIKPIVASKTEKEEISWQMGEQQIIYYRVAAGKTNGRKGLFSEPQRVDLSKLKELEFSRDLQPGVRIQVTKTKPLLPKSKVEKEKQEEQKKQEEEEEEEEEKKKATEEKANTDEKTASKAPPEPLPSDITFRIGGYWSSGLTINSQTGEDSVNISQQGFLLSRFGLELSLPLLGLGHLVFLSDIIEAPWTSTEPQELQDDLAQRDQTHSLRFGKTGSSQDYGIFYKVYDLATRSDLEIVELEEINPVGLAYFFRYGLFDRWASKHMLGIGYGDKYTHVQSDNYVYTNLELWDDNQADLGFEFNVRFGNGEGGRSYLGTNFLFRLGLMF